MKSVFQGSDDIRKVITETLGLSTDIKDKYDYTYPIYHTAFFYLQKRFGVSENYDEDKEAGVWLLEFKGVSFLFRFHSDSLEIWVLGTERDYLSYVCSPRVKACARALKKYPLVKLYPYENVKIGDLTKEELDLHNEEVYKFFGTHNPPIENIKENVDRWLEYVENFNIDRREELYKKHVKYSADEYHKLEDKYGKCNSRHRYLLKILRKLLKCFIQEPVWVRDVPFNIKGRISTNDVKHEWSDIKTI